MITDDLFEELPETEPAWAALDRITAYRKQLLAAGYSPVPVNGKRISLSDWQNIRATPAIIDTWAVTRADHVNTGVLTGRTPAIDIDITDTEAAEEIEALAKSLLGENAVRIGRPPKRCLLFRTDTPFRKLSATFVERDGHTHKIEILGTGQQVVVNGVHPETHQPYRWHGGEPGPKLRHEDLPPLTAETAAAFLAAASDLLTRYGWKAGENKKTNGADAETGRAEGASPRERAYAAAALDNVAEELAGTAAGDRNNKLYKTAFRIGTMVARGWIPRTEVEATLFDAAKDCGLVADDGEVQTRRTIASGLDDGAGAPHPDLPDQDALQESETETGQQEARPRCSLADAHRIFQKWLGDEYETLRTMADKPAIREGLL